ncbi:uncharacterized protein [Euwallacea similis]|uniref:uncharacterized protein n=1 Tax=Euwallacea similis TaxID=1736056 RepID=UPI0034510D30
MSISGDEQITAELDFKRLKNGKAQINGELTRFSNFLNKTDLDKSINVLQVRYDNAKSFLEKFNSIQAEYEMLLINDFPDNYDEDELAKERNIFETRYYEALAAAHDILNKHMRDQQQFAAVAANRSAGGASSSVVSQSGASQISVGALPNASVKLPSLTLPEFNGNYADWQMFRDMFNAIVHNNVTLSDAQRFYYLAASLKGEAKGIIASLAPTDANYATAWELLKKRYENKKIITNSHLKEIMGLPTLTKESHMLLRDFSNSFSKNYRALESLGEDVSGWKTLLIYILVSKLDSNTRREWENYCKDMNSPKIDDFDEFIIRRCQMLETLDTKVCSNSKKSNESKSFVAADKPYRARCPFCKEENFIYFCDKFKTLSISDRFEVVRKMKLCTNCLRYGHKSSECRSSGCKICRQKHATLLHKSQEYSRNATSNTSHDTGSGPPSINNRSNTPRDDNEQASVNATMTNACQNPTNCFILLSTAIVDVYRKDKTRVPCRVLLDSASQSNFVSSSMVKKLNLNLSKIDLPVIGINQIKTKISHTAEISLASRNTAFKTRLNFLVLPTITEFSPQNYFDKSKLNIPRELILADPNFNVPAEIDMLLGCEVFFDLLCIGQIKLGKNLPTLQKTLLGWIVAGRVPCGQGKVGKANATLSNCFLTQDSLNEKLERFWLVEEVNPNPWAKMTREELECESHFVQTTTRDKDGRFVVKLPLKDNFKELGESEQSALSRLYSIERRLAKHTELGAAYRTFMREYQDLGHMTEIPRELPSTKTPIYYIPHHCVEKQDSTTTKLRVVFDAACKTTKDLSLNDVLKVGPTIQNDVFSVLLRFRKHTFVLIGDLAKMYRQILVNKDERNLQRIVWRDTPNEEVKHFQLNTVTYGTASASYLSTRCLLEISSNIAEKWPTESDVIASDFYVDDLLTGASNLQSLKGMRDNILRTLSEYGFELRKLQSNDCRAVDDIVQTNYEANKYLITDGSSVKTLGVSWVPSLDTFEYNSQNISQDHCKVTKRTILSMVSKIFDPLGILGFLTVRIKLIIQGLWQLKIDWDESIPSRLYSEWLQLKDEIAQVGLIHVPRHVLVREPKIVELHGFSDASERAYGCCIYLRSVDANDIIESHLLCAKSRVSPLKSLSLPRLELLGALLLARLMKKSLEALKLDITKTVLWTDSTIVLCWIANEPKTWKTFIANRVAEIQLLSRVEDWNYIQSENKPADIISRGASIKSLANSKLWLHGPNFFIHPNTWLENSDISNFTSATAKIPETRGVSKLSLNIRAQNYEVFEKFSSLNKLIRVIAYCLRFIENLKLPKDKRNTGHLSSREVQRGELLMAKLAQSQAFSSEIQDLKRKNHVSRKSKLNSLSPFIDQDGVVRLGGRLAHSNCPHDSKHPIVLPAKHPFTRLVVDREHKRTFHAGIQGTLSHVRQKYWPINGKQIVKTHVGKCVTCFRVSPNAAIIPKMGELPKSRVTPSRPFLSVAVDYAGPFELKDGKTRSRKLIKGYISIFVCLATKAVHIEVITDLTSDGFLSMLKRFVSRRGLCSNIYSDNATNFVGCNNELISIQTLMNSSQFKAYTLHSNIRWQFMPARSPHWGGLHEAAVKSCKHHLKRVLNGTHLHYEEFYTLTTQIEAILNSRPLAPMSSDPNDLNAFTPAHFLIGQELTAIPERDLTSDKINFTKRYQHVQLMKQHFWSRWQKEYLHHLQQRNKWQRASGPNPHVGSLVLLKEDHVPPQCWPLGRIAALHPGKDDIVRVVTVKTKNGVVKRAVTRVSLLPVQ